MIGRDVLAWGRMPSGMMAVGQAEGGGTWREGMTAPVARRRRILVVDDEPALAAMIARMIEDEFDVELAADAHGAMANLTGSVGLPDVILCDLMMPHVSGADLYRDATRALPGIERRFVFMTGGAFTPWVADFLGSCQRPCLEKPFAYDALRRILS